MRYAIELAYNGSKYHGWQRQENAHTIQAELEKALQTILQEEIETLGCGRTDAGVHARYFVAHFDTDQGIPKDFSHRLNSILPKDISIYRTLEVAPSFHARFDAVLRTYSYYIHHQKNPFISGTSWLRPSNFDLEIMKRGAELLIGKKDFTCFCKGQAPNDNYTCEVTEAYWQLQDSGLKFTITANRFLRNMVRAIVGTLLDLGTHKINLSDFEKILSSGNRSDAGSSVPAEGLILEKVIYPEGF